MDPRAAEAEVSNPDSEVRASVRQSLRPDKNVCPLVLQNMRMASWGHGDFSCSGGFAQLQIV